MENKHEGLRSFASKKAMTADKHWMTIFTPAYQREATMGRVYESLLGLRLPKPIGGGKIVDFEWFIVNDGSTDGTENLVREWCEEDRIPIRYFYQENQGKHVACNFAVAHSSSEVFLSLDSDDTLLPDALTAFYDEWQRIPDKEHYKGVCGRCIDPETGKVIGPPLPSNPFDSTPQDLRLRYRHWGEMCGFNRTAVLREFPFIAPDPSMRFCPENIVWYEIGKKYKERYMDVPIRKYYRDTDNALTGRSTNRSAANYYLWQYGVNNLLGYWRFSPKEVLRHVVGMSMDGFRTGRSVRTMLDDAHNTAGKVCLLLFMPAGYVLAKR